MKGINSRINSVDKLKDFLRKELEGMTIVTCGSSAGGYAAALFGVLLDAESIFVNSGQFFLLPNQQYGPFVEICASIPNCSKYYDLEPLLLNKANVFYIYPAGCAEDQTHYEHIKKLDGISTLMIGSKAHGHTISGICWPYLLTMKNDARIKLFQKNKGQIVSGKIIRREVVPFTFRLCFAFSKGISQVKQRLFLFWGTMNRSSH